MLRLVSKRSRIVAPDQIKYSIARSRSDLEDAFRLVYRSYVRASLDSPNESGMRLTPYHLLPTTDVVLVKDAGVAISTASIIVDGPLGLPAESIYGKEIDAMRRQGLRIAEIGSLADRRESPARFLQMFRRMSKLIAQTAAARGCNALIAATHPRHARFYVRQLGFEQVGDIRSCPYAQGNPAVALLLDFEKHRGTRLYDHLFGQEYTPKELKPYTWDNRTRKYFSSILERSRTQSTHVDVPVFAPVLTSGSVHR